MGVVFLVYAVVVVVVVVVVCPLPCPCWRGGEMNAGWLEVMSGGVGSGMVVKSFCTNPSKCVIKLVGLMLQSSVVLSRMQVRVGDSHPAERLVKIPLQWGRPCAIL